MVANRRWGEIIASYVDEALTQSTSNLKTMRSLILAIVIGVALLAAMTGLRHVGVWGLIFLLWAVIIGILLRYRDRMSVRRVLTALKSEESRRPARERGEATSPAEP